MIKIVDFYKSYSPHSPYAVENVSMTINDKSVTALLGRNGSGKTTIIKAICGLHFPSKGKIIVTDYDGKEYDLSTENQMAMKLSGFVPENPCLPKEMKVKDFLHYAANLHSLYDDKEEKAVSNVIKDCFLQDLLTKKIKTLSKGQLQRVSFAQAIIHNPPNLILDEPITGLDPAQIIQMRKLIEKLAQTKAILMSTHILQEVYSLNSRIYIINDGKSIAHGSESQIIEKTGCKNLEEAFLKLSGGFSE